MAWPSSDRLAIQGSGSRKGKVPTPRFCAFLWERDKATFGSLPVSTQVLPADCEPAQGGLEMAATALAF